MKTNVLLRGRAWCLPFVFCVMVPGFSNVYAQTVRYVDADAPGANDGEETGTQLASGLGGRSTRRAD